jgi:hypothetical protein
MDILSQFLKSWKQSKNIFYRWLFAVTSNTNTRENRIAISSSNNKKKQKQKQLIKYFDNYRSISKIKKRDLYLTYKPDI